MMQARAENRRANLLRRFDDELPDREEDAPITCGCGRWWCDGDGRDESPVVEAWWPDRVVTTPRGSGIVVSASYGHVGVALTSGERLCFSPDEVKGVDVVSRLGHLARELGLVAQ
jgi:hypothetical protein